MRVRSLSFNDDPEGKAVLYASGACGQVYSPKSVGLKNAVGMAEKCCLPEHRTCNACGKEVPKYRNLCTGCAELVRLRKVTQIEAEDWTDPVHLDGAPGGWGEGYFSDTDDLRQSCEDYDVSMPAYCWPCTSRQLRLEPDSLLEQAADDMHEDAMDQIVDADGLCDFIEAWNARQTCKSWRPDMSRVVVLDRERFEEVLKNG